MERIVRIAEQLVEDLRAANREEGILANPTPHCLVVEDEPADAELSRVALESVGAEVRTASTGDEAIQLLENSENPLIPDFHMVFLDLVLRGSRSQGIEVLKFIRAKFPKLHVIIVSGHIDADLMSYLTRLQEGGYVGIVTKPLHEMNVLEIISKHSMFAGVI